MPFERILVPLDGSPTSEEALPHAVRMAQAFGSQLLLFRVLEAPPSEPGPAPADWRLRTVEAQRYLNNLAVRLRAAGVDVACEVAEGRPAERIVEALRQHQVSLLVLCAYGWGGESGFPFGGTVQKLITSAEVSFAVVRPAQSGEADPVPASGYRRVVVPLDGSQRAEWAVAMAASLVDREHGELILLQVIPSPEMPRRRPLTQEEQELSAKVVECNRRAAESYLEDIRAHAVGAYHVRPLLVVAPNIVDTIHRVAAAEGADLIALAARANTCSDDRQQGSVSRALIAHGSRPMLVLQDVRRSTVVFLGEDAEDAASRSRAAVSH